MKIPRLDDRHTLVNYDMKIFDKMLFDQNEEATVVLSVVIKAIMKGFETSC